MKRFKNQKAFTLMELMVAMGLGMVIIAAVTTTFNSQTKFYSSQEQINEMQQNARGAMDIISRELKLAGFKNNDGAPPTGLTASGVNLDTTNLVIQADLDGNNLIDTTAGSLENISYSYDSTNNRIKRRLGSAASDVLAENITNFTFTYLKADGTTATLASQIRQVKIDITARTAKPDPDYSANGGYRTFTISETITPPNLAF
jgi:type IV pilus assembly protein PilW